MKSQMRSLGVAQGFLVCLALILGPAALLYLRPAVDFQDPSAARIIVFHLPMAWLCTIWFVVAAVYGVRYLRQRRLEDDAASAAAAGLGLLCCILATVTGSIFAHSQWGSWWNWDPRETSIFYLLLIYGAYMSLRGSMEEPVRRAHFSAVYALLACLVMPFLVFVLPRMAESLHPSHAQLAGSYWALVLAALAGFGFYLTWVFRIRCAVDCRILAQAAAESREPLSVMTPTPAAQPGQKPVQTGTPDAGTPNARTPDALQAGPAPAEALPAGPPPLKPLSAGPLTAGALPAGH